MKFQLPSVLVAITALCACGDDDKTRELNQEIATAAQAHYAVLVSATYEDSLGAAKDLDEAIRAFVTDPSESGLEAAKSAWIDAREPYLLTEAFRFYEGPIDNGEDGPEGLLNAWPLDENYIDYVDGREDSGIINDTSVTIDADALMDSNEKGGEKNIATGYHAIEFLLWGQDMNDDGPGNRPYTDFMDGGTAENQERRRRYLSVVSELLVTHLEDITAAWKIGEDNYRMDFVAEAPEEAMRRILTGLTVLSGFETGAERLQPALDTGEQEDEHSCFSDNTHRDMIQDVQGIKNVFLGEYTRSDSSNLSGTSIYYVIAATNHALADAIRDAINDSLALAKKLEAPFDQEIHVDNEEGKKRVAGLVQALKGLTREIDKVFPLFELEIPAPE